MDHPIPVTTSGADVPTWVRASLRCPVCRAELRDGDARLECTGCGRRYPVSDGIPVLIAEHAQEAAR